MKQGRTLSPGHGFSDYLDGRNRLTKACQLWLVRQTAAWSLWGYCLIRVNGEACAGGRIKDSRFMVSIEAVSVAAVEWPSKKIVFEGKLTRLRV